MLPLTVRDEVFLVDMITETLMTGSDVAAHWTTDSNLYTLWIHILCFHARSCCSIIDHMVCSDWSPEKNIILAHQIRSCIVKFLVGMLHQMLEKRLQEQWLRAAPEWTLSTIR